MARRRRPVVSCCTPSTKRDAGPHERQQVRAVEPTPTSLRHVEELVGHQETLRSRALALRHALAEPDGRERGLDHVRGPQMLPV
jgi:hypothetical protein